jgi:hypothetical protein
MSADKPLKRYSIQVRGFDACMVEAKTAGAARWKNYVAWRDAGYGRHVSFGDFLKSEIETFYHHGRALDKQQPSVI